MTGNVDVPHDHGLSRRHFLQAVGGGLLAGPVLEALRGSGLEALAGPPIGPADGILVVLVLYGGNDALNTFVPYSDPLYYASRPNLAIPAEQVLHVDAWHGFHPQLGYLRSLYDSGQVAVVQGLGYPNPNLSHFSSMATWMSGGFGSAASLTGWVGRWLDGQPAATGDLAAASIGTTVPLHMTGAVRRAVGVSELGDMFGAGAGAPDLRMHAGLMSIADASGQRGALHDMFAVAMRRQLEVASGTKAAFSTPVAADGLVARMTVAARLINADVGLRVIDVGQEGYDHHELQTSRHLELLAELDAALRAFFATLAPRFADRVAVMTISEFGRTSESNASYGSDHGTVSAQFLIGRNVRGGQYGAPPSLSKLDRNRRMYASLDFRALYGSVLDGWMGGGGSTIVNGPFEELGLFHGGPGSAPAVPGRPVAAAPLVPTSLLIAPTGFVPLSPVRLFDTRDGTGGRARPLGAGERWDFVFGTDRGVPGTASAVAFNLTAVDASRPSFVTAWPAGDARPSTANLNPVPGGAVPNLVVAALGPAGAVSMFNHDGDVHLVGDLVGYFNPSTTVGLAPLTPARLLDTRDGSGTPVGPGQTIELEVAGRGGVADSCVAVALNITVTEATAPSFLTVWPAGQPRPLAASLNTAGGQTVQNLVLAQVKGGRIAIFNLAGSAHVVVDVLGCFGDGFPGRYVPITPARVLDTRLGIGAPAVRVGRQPLSLPLVGRLGIPAIGVGAVLINVTVVDPDADTYLTVYPSGAPRPLAANINARRGQVVPNMAVGCLGPDGAVALFNFAGTTDLVVDAVGYFTTA